jgi:hypothetical protein
MSHPFKYVPVLALAVLLLAGPSACAQLLYEDFESYNLGTLDKNDPNGPNQDPNGSGNPWFGPEISSPNLVVVGPENGVTPISGNQMVRGRAPSDFDQDWFNLAYRLNGGQPFQENVVMAWWFYDPLGAGGTDYKDFAALAFYSDAPSDTDAPATYNLNHSALVQRLSLGASSVQDAGFDSNYYQARVVGAADGYDAAGWFNTNTPRSVGWHYAAIVIGALQDDGTNDVLFFIDDLANPTLEHNSVSSYGYNIIELNANYGAANGYYDDVSFDVLSGGS